VKRGGKNLAPRTCRREGEKKGEKKKNLHLCDKKEDLVASRGEKKRKSPGTPLAIKAILVGGGEELN